MVDAELLRYITLDDDTADRVYRQHPKMKADSDEFCPTCDTDKSFYWDGRMQKCDCQLQLQLHKHYLASGIGVNYQRLSWDDYRGDPAVQEWVELYISKHKNYVNRGIGAIFHGTYGVGKTFATTMLLKDLIKLGHVCYSTTFQNMVEMYTAGWRSRDDQSYFESKMIGSDVLLLDDLGRGMKTKTNLAESTFDNVLRRRVNEGKVTLITTNMSLGELQEGYGGAILSLLWESSLRYEMTGDDFRPQSGDRLQNELRDGLVRPIF